MNSFFENYARALEQYDTKGLAFMYNFPCTMLSDDAVSTFNDAGKLEGFFNQGMSFYRQFGIAHVRHEVWNRRDITSRIMVAKVIWQYFDALKAPIYNCEYHYTLRLDRNNNWRIVQSVAVDEKERVEEWQARQKHGQPERTVSVVG